MERGRPLHSDIRPIIRRWYQLGAAESDLRLRWVSTWKKDGFIAYV